MIKEPDPMIEAQTKAEFRQLYRDIGKAGCLQIVYEILLSGQWLVDIMLEESKGESND